MAGTRRLIVGLGNPTPQYKATRHNVGFAVVEQLCGKEPWRKDGRAQALVADRKLRGRPVLLVKPQTFMNRSGDAVANLARRYACRPESIMVVADDLNLPLGMLRIRASGSAGGHNGMQDIMDALGSEAFARLRIGIGTAYKAGQQSRFVLAPFTADERPVIEEAIVRAAQGVTTYVTEGITQAMNRFNRRVRKVASATPSPPPPPQSTPPRGALE